MNKSARFAMGSIAAALAGMLASAASAGPPAGGASAQTTYQRERAACTDGRSQQDRATCLKEAGAAREEARRNRLGNGEDAAALSSNAVRRCSAAKPEDRDDCLRLARGAGVVSGTPQSGGVMKELVTRSPGAAPPAASATPAQPAAPR